MSIWRKAFRKNEQQCQEPTLGACLEHLRNVKQEEVAALQRLSHGRELRSEGNKSPEHDTLPEILRRIWLSFSVSGKMLQDPEFYVAVTLGLTCTVLGSGLGYGENRSDRLDSLAQKCGTKVHKSFSPSRIFHELYSLNSECLRYL